MSWIDQTLQENGTLKNRAGVLDKKVLQKLEFRITQVKYLSIPNYSITSIDDLKKVHYWLFSDLYSWAGKYRPGDFSKDNTVFQPRKLFDVAVVYLNKQIKHINDSDYATKSLFAIDMGQLLIDINHFHPFREGNGRAQRLFITLLARQKGYEVHLGKADPVYQSYMRASIDDDAQTMSKVIMESL